MLRSTGAAARLSQQQATETPRRLTRSQRTMESASESSAGEEPFIPSSSMVDMSTPTAARRTRGSQRSQVNPARPSQNRRAMRSSQQASQGVLRERVDGGGDDAERTPRGILNGSGSQAQTFEANGRRISLNVPRPPVSTRSDRSGTHRSRLSELTARQATSSPAPRLRRALQVRPSLGPHQTVTEMGLARRAELVTGVAGDCIVKLLRWPAGSREQELAKDAFQTLFRNRQTYIFSPHAPPFPDLHTTMDALAPAMKTSENLTLLGSALQTSNLATWLYAVLQPDAAGELLMAGLESEGDNLLSVAADRKGKGRQSLVEEDMEATERRVRLRNDLLVMAWKRFWFVVVPKEDRESEGALTLWLDFASFIVLNWRRSSLDPLTRPSTALPAIPHDLMRSLFTTVAITRYGQWSEDEDMDTASEGENESQAARNAISQRWRTLAKRRLNELTEKDARVLDRQSVWSRWQQEAVAFVGSEVVEGSDLLQTVEIKADRRSVSVKRRLSEISQDPAGQLALQRQEREQRRKSNGPSSRRSLQPQRDESVSAAEADDEGQGDSVDGDAAADTMDEDGSESSETPVSPSEERHETADQKLQRAERSGIPEVLQHNAEDDVVDFDMVRDVIQEMQAEERERNAHALGLDAGQGEEEGIEGEGAGDSEDAIDFALLAYIEQEMQKESEGVEVGAVDEDDTGHAPDQQRDADDDEAASDDSADFDSSEEDSDEGEEPFLPPTHIIEGLAEESRILQPIQNDQRQGSATGDPTPPRGTQRGPNEATTTLRRFTSQSTSQQQEQAQRPMFHFAAHQAEAEQIGWDDEPRVDVEIKEEHQDVEEVDHGEPDTRDEQDHLGQQVTHGGIARGLDDDREDTEGSIGSRLRTASADIPTGLARQAGSGQDGGYANSASGNEAADADLDILDHTDEQDADLPTVPPPLGTTPARRRNTSPNGPLARMPDIRRRPSAIHDDAFALVSDTEDEQDQKLLTRHNIANLERQHTPLFLVDNDAGAESESRQDARERQLVAMRAQSMAASEARWDRDSAMLIPPGPRGPAYAPQRDPSRPIGRRATVGGRQEGELYMVDEYGDELIPNEEYVLPDDHDPPPSNHRKGGPRRQWTPVQALLLYRTLQQVPMSQPLPIAVVDYLHGEFGELSQMLGMYSRQQMKDKMVTILETRRNNAWPVVGRARQYMPRGSIERQEYEEDRVAYVDGMRQHLGVVKVETEKQYKERKAQLALEARRAQPEEDEEAEEVEFQGDDSDDDDGDGGDEDDAIDNDAEIGAVDEEDELDSHQEEASPPKTRSKARQKRDVGVGQGARTTRNAKAKATRAASDRAKRASKRNRVQAVQGGNIPDAGEMTRSDDEYRPKRQTPQKRKKDSARSVSASARKTARTTASEPAAPGSDVDELDDTDQEDEARQAAAPAAARRRSRRTPAVELPQRQAPATEDPAPVKQGRRTPRKQPKQPTPPAEAEDAGPEAANGASVTTRTDDDDQPAADPILRQPVRGARRGGKRGGFNASMGLRRATLNDPEQVEQDEQIASARSASSPSTPKKKTTTPSRPGKSPASSRRKHLQSDQDQDSDDGDDSFVDAQMALIPSSPATGTRSARRVGIDAAQAEDATQVTEDFVRQQLIRQKVMQGEDD